MAGVPVGRLLGSGARCRASRTAGPRPAPASGSSSRTRRWTARHAPAGPTDRARAGPHGIGCAPRQRRDLHGDARPASRSGATTGSTSTPVRDRPRHRRACSRPWSRPARRRCSNSMFASPTVVGQGGQHLARHTGRRGARAAAPARPDRAVNAPGRRPALPRGPDPDGRRRRAGGNALPPATGVAAPSRASSRRCPTARTTSRRRTARTTSGCATSTRTPSAASTCAAPARPAATRPTSTRPASSGTCAAVIAWLAEPGLVRRQHRHVRHVVLRLQLAADGVRAARASSRRSSRSTAPTTATPTTCTTAAASSRCSTWSTTATT